VAVENIEVAITKEGLEDIAKLIAIGVTEGVAGTTNFKVGFFRLGSLGNSANFESKKETRGGCNNIYYVNYYSGIDFDSDYKAFDAEHTTTLDPNITGYVTINSIEYVEPVAPAILGTVEISCYITPGFANTLVSKTFTCNEIMVYTGAGTVDNPYRSFIYGIFPEITKEEEYGINLKISCEF